MKERNYYVKSLDHSINSFKTNQLSQDVLRQTILYNGYSYHDLVLGVPKIVTEITYYQVFKEVDLKEIISLTSSDNYTIAQQILSSAKESNADETINEVYFVKDYIPLAYELRRLKREKATNRQRSTIIHFDKNHCFQSLQFMKASDSNKVIANMRSCNLEKNFLIDLALTWIVANEYFNDNKQISLIMNIASLHVLKDVQ